MTHIVGSGPIVITMYDVAVGKGISGHCHSELEADTSSEPGNFFLVHWIRFHGNIDAWWLHCQTMLDIEPRADTIMMILREQSREMRRNRHSEQQADTSNE